MLNIKKNKILLVVFLLVLFVCVCIFYNKKKQINSYILVEDIKKDIKKYSNPKVIFGDTLCETENETYFRNSSTLRDTNKYEIYKINKKKDKNRKLTESERQRYKKSLLNMIECTQSKFLGILGFIRIDNKNILKILEEKSKKKLSEGIFMAIFNIAILVTPSYTILERTCISSGLSKVEDINSSFKKKIELFKQNNNSRDNQNKNQVNVNNLSKFLKDVGNDYMRKSHELQNFIVDNFSKLPDKFLILELDNWEKEKSLKKHFDTLTNTYSLENPILKECFKLIDKSNIKDNKEYIIDSKEEGKYECYPFLSID